METIAFVPIVTLVIGLGCLSIGFISRRIGLLVLGVVSTSMSMSAPFVQSLALEWIGVGITLPIAVVLAGVLILEVIRRRLITPPDLLGLPGGLLGLAILACIGSCVTAAEPPQAFKATALLLLAAVSGWMCLGSLAGHMSNPRLLTQLLVGSVGLVSVLTTISVLFILGPSCLQSGEGGLNNQVSMFGWQLSRLGVHGFNATGVTTAAATGLLILICSIDQAKSWPIRLLGVALMMICLVALLWSGSRGGLAAFVMVLVAIRVLSRRYGLVRWTSVGADFVVAAVVVVVGLQFQENYWRDQGADRTARSAVETFMESRVPDELRDYIVQPTLLGHGYNSLSPSRERDEPDIESYWLKAWVELGSLGSVVYTAAFVVLTSLVVRADAISARTGAPAAFAPSAVLLFVWANSISSWGFIHPFGDMTIKLGMMSAACVVLAHRVDRPGCQPCRVTT